MLVGVMAVVHFATVRLGRYLGPIAKDSFRPHLVDEGSILSSNSKSTTHHAVTVMLREGAIFF